MDYFIHCITTSKLDDGSLLFLCHLLGPKATALTQAMALKFCAHHVGLPDSPSVNDLLDLSLGLFVLKKLDMGRVQLQGQRREFVLGRLVQQVDAALKSYSWHEVFGFDKIEDDEDLCDAMVWMSVFEHVGLSAFASRRLGVQQMVLLHRQGYVEHQDQRQWEWTSYLVTHVVYILSDWGTRSAQESCRGEVVYILDNLPRALAEEDLELVGEFLYCLRILNVPLGAAQQALVLEARDLLMSPMDAIFKSTRVSFYKKYHTAWCVVVGFGE